MRKSVRVLTLGGENSVGGNTEHTLELELEPELRKENVSYEGSLQLSREENGKHGYKAQLSI